MCEGDQKNQRRNVGEGCQGEKLKRNSVHSEFGRCFNTGGEGRTRKKVERGEMRDTKTGNKGKRKKVREVLTARNGQTTREDSMGGGDLAGKGRMKLYRTERGKCQ